MDPQNLQPLFFHWVQYPATRFLHWYNYPAGGADLFVFALYYPPTSNPNPPIWLCAFAYNSTNNVYYNGDDPDILLPYGHDSLALTGPLQFSVNQVDADLLFNLLGPDPGENDYLLFEPARDNFNRVYYLIYHLVKTANGVTITDTPVTTNPSPPAT